MNFAWIETDDAENTDDPDALWYITMAHVRDAASDSPSITRSRVSDHPMHVGDICLHGTLCQLAPNGLGGGSRTLGDFFEMSIGPDGMAQVAWSDDGREGEPKQVWWAKAAGRPSAFGGTVGTPAEPAGPGTPSGGNPPADPPAAAPTRPYLPATGLPSAVPDRGAGPARAGRRRAGPAPSLRDVTTRKLSERSSPSGE